MNFYTHPDHPSPEPPSHGLIQNYSGMLLHMISTNHLLSCRILHHGKASKKEEEINRQHHCAE